MILILALTSLVVLFSAGLLLSGILSAPEGFENDTGFHFKPARLPVCDGSFAGRSGVLSNI